MFLAVEQKRSHPALIKHETAANCKILAFSGRGISHRCRFDAESRNQADDFGSRGKLRPAGGTGRGSKPSSGISNIRLGWALEKATNFLAEVVQALRQLIALRQRYPVVLNLEQSSPFRRVLGTQCLFPGCDCPAVASLDFVTNAVKHRNGSQASAAYRGSANPVSTVYDVNALTHGVCMASRMGNRSQSEWLSKCTTPCFRKWPCRNSSKLRTKLMESTALEKTKR